MFYITDINTCRRNIEMKKINTWYTYKTLTDVLSLEASILQSTNIGTIGKYEQNWLKICIYHSLAFKKCTKNLTFD